MLKALRYTCAALIHHARMGLLLAVILASSCLGSLTQDPFTILWLPEDNFEHRSMQLFTASSREYPIKAWYAEIAPTIHCHVIVAPGGTLQSPVDMAIETQACIIINGGQFRSDYDPPRHVGLLKARGELIEQAIPSILWAEKRYHVARGAFGLTADNRPTVAWVMGGRNQLRAITDLPRHEQGAPDLKLTHQPESTAWDVIEAIGGGPVLVHNGAVSVSATAEGFWADGIDQPHPRTAIGYTADERLILMVVDGRQEGSPGVNLLQLAAMMATVGCVEAINLDGGGSSAMVVNGALVNSPEGTDQARPILSAIGIFCKIHIPPASE